MMRVVYAMTRNLYPCFKPTLTSLLEHNDVEKIYILAEDDHLPYPIPDMCEVVNVSGQKWFPKDGPNVNSIYTYMAMVRLCYPFIFPTERKLIQLDIDTIICDSLEPLWEIDLTDKWCAACPEYESYYRPFGPEYYNVGVAVFNLEQMRRDDIVMTLIDEVNTVCYPCVEQDVLNLYGLPRDKFVPIPVRYNESFCCGHTDNPAVVHYAGYRNWYDNWTMPYVEYLNKYR